MTYWPERPELAPGATDNEVLVALGLIFLTCRKFSICGHTGQYERELKPSTAARSRRIDSLCGAPSRPTGTERESPT